MINKEEVISVFREKKIKLTPQRIAIKKKKKKRDGHYSAEDIYTTLKKDFPYMSFSTVYNTLKTLSELQVVEELYLFDKKVVFDNNTTPHIHFLCTKCGKIYDIKSSKDFNLDANLRSNIMIPEGLVEKVHVYMYGICKECLKKERKSSN